MTLNIAVLASHNGTTLQAVLDACALGTLPARVGLVLSNNGDSGALQRARTVGVRAAHLSGRTHSEPNDLDHAICAALDESEAQLILLAGYMKKLGPKTLASYARRIINTHPALLPRHGGQGMFGMHVHRAVLAAGDTESGASVHIVEGNYDTGPVLAQCRVPVLPNDSAEELAGRVQASERLLLVDVLREIATGARPLPLA
ncbi:MAG: phosphoribosylglycinamide formyltransferase [Polyangiaceae bacterium]